MGDSEIPNPFKKWKKRAKRFACGGFLSLVFGVICFVCGIALLVKFAEFWGDEEEKVESAVSYFGCAILILGFLLICIGMGIFITICIVYRRLTKAMDGPAGQFKPPTFAPGQAPYPQQKPFIPPQGPAASPTAPGAPTPEKSMPQANPADVNVEITENYKF